MSTVQDQDRNLWCVHINSKAKFNVDHAITPLQILLLSCYFGTLLLNEFSYLFFIVKFNKFYVNIIEKQLRFIAKRN